MNAATYSAIALATVGLYIAGYFTLVYYGIVSASTKLMPDVCRLEELTCQTDEKSQQRNQLKTALGIVVAWRTFAFLVI